MNSGFRGTFLRAAQAPCAVLRPEAEFGIRTSGTRRAATGRTRCGRSPRRRETAKLRPGSSLPAACAICASPYSGAARHYAGSLQRVDSPSFRGASDATGPGAAAARSSRLRTASTASRVGGPLLVVEVAQRGQQPLEYALGVVLRLLVQPVPPGPGCALGVRGRRRRRHRFRLGAPPAGPVASGGPCKREENEERGKQGVNRRSELTGRVHSRRLASSFALRLRQRRRMGR